MALDRAVTAHLAHRRVEFDPMRDDETVAAHRVGR